MKTPRVEIKSGNLVIVLKSDSELLDEVVVTAMGISSLSSNNPLYIVDGVPINNDRIGNDTVDYGNGGGDQG